MKVSASDILGASILLVDDQQDNIDLLRHMLADAGYTNVTWTSDPEEVCALNRKNRYDLILLDLQMPKMDGFQVIEALKTNDADDYLRVLVITAQPGHKLRALECGVRDFISKPFDIVEAQFRIRNMLEVSLLYKRLEAHGRTLEATVEERTAELRESEARFRSLTELSSDWYWEQDENGHFTKVSGPVLEMLGLQVEPLEEGTPALPVTGWDEAERSTLRAAISARQPFLDFHFSRIEPDGTRRQFRVSGEPMFDRFCTFIGYRGVGVEILADNHAHGLKRQ